MKKLMVLILSLACVVGLIVYCNSLPKKQSVSNGVSYSDVEGFFVEINGIYSYPDITSLSVSWNNKTEYTVTYGDEYWIERLENDEWVDCSLQANIFTLIAHSLNANETIDEEYRLTDMYDISKPGTYRFRSDCSVDVGGEKECSVWAEFVIG